MAHVDSAGVRIHYDVVGHGFPIVLHTGAGGDGTMWTEGSYVEGLDGFTSILIDQRGHGQSDKPIGIANHHIEQYVADVIALLDALGIDRTAFWGYSAGSWVGYALGATHPERIVTLIASGHIGSGDHCEVQARAQSVESARLVRQMGVGPVVAQLEETEVIQFLVWFQRHMDLTDREMFALEVLGAAEWRGPWSLLPRITMPVLMLVGELEDPDGDNRRAASAMLNGQCITLEGLGHVGAYLRSDLALSHALPFLRNIRQEAASL